MAIPRFQGSSPRLCWLSTVSFGPWWQALICTDYMSGFMKPDKPSSPVTTLLNRKSLLHGGLLKGEWGSPGWRPGRTIAGSQDFIPAAGARFWLSRDFTDGCRMWDPRGHAYDMLVRFFPSRVYINSSRRDTLGYEWSFVHCCHLVVCLVVLLAWIRECWIWLCYHDDYCITLLMTLTLVNIMLIYTCYSL
jgi:hypothetical protein